MNDLAVPAAYNGGSFSVTSFKESLTKKIQNE